MLEDLTDEQRAWALETEALWREADSIVERHPDLDRGDVYHALRSLQKSPAERLREGLGRVRRVRPQER